MRVIIARDMDEMVRLLSQGRVDLFLDSTFPTLAVQQHSGSRILLRRWAQDAAEYRSLFVTSHDSGIDSLDDLRGSVLALQEEYSTSGFLLPAGTLARMGYELMRVGGPDERPTREQIHYFFTHDEENTIELVSNGRTPAGVISDQEYDQLPEDLRQQLRIIGETPTAPRQLLSVRSDLEPALIELISDALLDLATADEEPVALEDSVHAWTWKFDHLTPASAAQIDHLRELIALLEIK